MLSHYLLVNWINETRYSRRALHPPRVVDVYQPLQWDWGWEFQGLMLLFLLENQLWDQRMRFGFKLQPRAEEVELGWYVGKTTAWTNTKLKYLVLRPPPNTNSLSQCNYSYCYTHAPMFTIDCFHFAQSRWCRSYSVL